MKYCDTLPRKIKGHYLNNQRCQILLDNGERCTNNAYAEVEGHLDNEIYFGGPDWTTFLVCKKHFEKSNGMFGEIKEVQK